MKRARAVCVAVVATFAALFCVALHAEGQGAVRIENLTVSALTPLTVEFDVANGLSQEFPRVRGQVALSESTGAPVDQLPVDPFELPAGSRVHVRVQSRWELQLAGTYMVDAALDLGEGALVSASLPFRIAPIELPLAPATVLEGPMLTLAQEPSSWGLDRIKARAAWAMSHGSPDIVVAVIDSGIDHTIPQLQDCLWVNEDEIPDNDVDDDRNGYIDDVHGWDFRDGDASSLVGTPIHGHGTGVAAILAARPGRYPIVGVAPGVRLIDVRFLDSSNTFRSSDWKDFGRAVAYAVDNGADIINLSIFANAKPPSSFEQAIAAARARGVIVVGIAGNQGKAEVMYPGRYDSLVTVSAVSVTDQLASFSSYGSEIDICAPGEAVMTFTVGGRVISQSGTSFSAPHVSGVLALLLSASPGLAPDRAVEILEATATDLGVRGQDSRFGYGIVDAWAAIMAAAGR